MKNSIKTWTRWGCGSSAGEAAGPPGPAGHPSPLLSPLEAELEFFLAGSPSLYLTWIPPAVLSVKVDSAILCLSFSGCRLSSTLGCLHVSHSSSTLSLRPTPVIRSRLPCTWRRRGLAGAGRARLTLTPFPHSARCETEEAVHLPGYKEERLLGRERAVGSPAGAGLCEWNSGCWGPKVGVASLQCSLLALLTPGCTWLLGLQASWSHLPRQRQGRESM